MPVIRRATSADAQAIGEVHVAAWSSAYELLLPASLLANQSVDRRVRFWKDELQQPSTSPNATWVVEDDGAVVGFASSGPCRDEDRADPGDWELFAIYLLAQYWGRGLGFALVERLLRDVPPRASSVSLWVLAGNARAISFYESVGFAADGTCREEVLGGQPVTELRYVLRLPWIGTSKVEDTATNHDNFHDGNLGVGDRMHRGSSSEGESQQLFEAYQQANIDEPREAERPWGGPNASLWKRLLAASVEAAGIRIGRFPD